MSIRPQAGMKVEVPGVVVEMRDRVIVDLGRWNDKYGVGKPRDPRVQLCEEIPEVRMGDESVFEDREAYMSLSAAQG